MRVAPVRRYPAPSYPTRAILDAHPEWMRLVPRRWRRHPAVLSTAALACALLAGCRSGGSSREKPHARVAPLFRRGDGLARMRPILPAGLVGEARAPAMTEDAAREVVVAAARRAGVRFADVPPTLHDVLLPGEPPSTGIPWAGPRQPLVLDGADVKRHIAYEVVTVEDSRQWNMALSAGPAGPEDTCPAARMLIGKLSRSAPGWTYAVFYDPQSGSPDAEADLAWQVRDFIAWLKGQGSI